MARMAVCAVDCAGSGREWMWARMSVDFGIWRVALGVCQGGGYMKRRGREKGMRRKGTRAVRGEGKGRVPHLGEHV